MVSISSRVPIITFLTFLLALGVNYLPASSEPFFLNAPLGLVFSIGCSVFLVIYYILEIFIFHKEL